MKKAKAVVESELKKYIIRIHREVFGKGPKTAWVKINSNVATFHFTQPLTPLEEFLVGTPGGEEEVVGLRKKVAAHLKPRLYSEIEILCGVKVLSIAAEICLRSNTLFGAILLESHFE